MKDNKTELWEKNSASTRYNMPEQCPTCHEQDKYSSLKTTYLYVGIFPYIHADITMICPAGHKFNFCMPYNKAMTAGYTVFDSTLFEKPLTDKKCPFHQVKLEAIRLYGDLVFADGTKKLQIRCPICYYSERYVI